MCNADTGKRTWVAGYVMETTSGRLQPEYLHAGTTLNRQGGAVLLTRKEAEKQAVAHVHRHYLQVPHITPFIVPYGGAPQDRVYLIQPWHKPSGKAHH